jgi:hypothetical protein
MHGTSGFVAFTSLGPGRLSLRAASMHELAEVRGLGDALEAAGDALVEVVIGDLRLDLAVPSHADLWAAAAYLYGRSPAAAEFPAGLQPAAAA